MTMTMFVLLLNDVDCDEGLSVWWLFQRNAKIANVNQTSERSGDRENSRVLARC